MNEYITVIVSHSKTKPNAKARIVMGDQQMDVTVEVLGCWDQIASELVDVPGEGSDLICTFAQFRPNRER